MAQKKFMYSADAIQNAWPSIYGSLVRRVHLNKKILNTFLLIINIISFVLVFLFGVSGIIYELFGAANYEKMLAKRNIPFSFERIWLFMFLCLIILIITYIVRKSVLKNKQ